MLRLQRRWSKVNIVLNIDSIISTDYFWTCAHILSISECVWTQKNVTVSHSIVQLSKFNTTYIINKLEEDIHRTANFTMKTKDESIKKYNKANMFTWFVVWTLKLTNTDDVTNFIILQNMFSDYLAKTKIAYKAHRVKL